MAINTNPGTPLRHVATFNATGNWTAPTGTNVAFVSIKGASGGGGGGGGRYNDDARGNGKAGGAGIISGAWVQVTPGSSHAVTIGAAGAAGAGSGGVANGSDGSSGGTTIFDAVFRVIGGGGGQGGHQGFVTVAGATGTSSGTTALTDLPPSANSLTRVSTITNQSTGATAAGVGGNFTSRYAAKNSGTGGAAATVEIYI